MRLWPDDPKDIDCFDILFLLALAIILAIVWALIDGRLS